MEGFNDREAVGVASGRSSRSTTSSVVVMKLFYCTSNDASLAWPDPVFAQGRYQFQYKRPARLPVKISGLATRDYNAACSNATSSVAVVTLLQ